MELTAAPLPPEIWAATPAAAQVLINAQRERIRDLETHLDQHSFSSSRPPSSDPPQAARVPDMNLALNASHPSIVVAVGRA
jgi:hypothetical protein